MQQIRFVAFNGKSITSAAIRFFTRSQGCSHIAYLSLDDTLIECWRTRRNHWSAWITSDFSNHTNGTEYEIWGKDFEDAKAKEIDKFFYDILRTKYDWFGVVGFVIRSIKHSIKRMFCSEGCIFPIVKFCGLTETVPGHVDPQDFKRIIQAAQFIKIKSGVVTDGK